MTGAVFSPRPDGTPHLPSRGVYLRPGRQTRATAAPTSEATALPSGVGPGAARTGSTACPAPTPSTPGDGDTGGPTHDESGPGVREHPGPGHQEGPHLMPDTDPTPQPDTGPPVKLPPRPGHDTYPASPRVPMTTAAGCTCGAYWSLNDGRQLSYCEWAATHPHPLQEQADEGARALRTLADLIHQNPDLVDGFKSSDFTVHALTIDQYDRLAAMISADHDYVYASGYFTERRRRIGPLVVGVSIRTGALTEAGQ